MHTICNCMQTSKKSKTQALLRYFLYYLINTACFTRYCYSQAATPQLIRVGKFDKNKIRSGMIDLLSISLNVRLLHWIPPPPLTPSRYCENVLIVNMSILPISLQCTSAKLIEQIIKKKNLCRQISHCVLMFVMIL